MEGLREKRKNIKRRGWRGGGGKGGGAVAALSQAVGRTEWSFMGL